MWSSKYKGLKQWYNNANNISGYFFPVSSLALLRVCTPLLTGLTLLTRFTSPLEAAVTAEGRDGGVISATVVVSCRGVEASLGGL